MNKTFFMGRLVADPEIRYAKTEDGMCIATFRLAVDRPYARKDDEVKADFFSCTAFRQKAEFVEKFLSKGIKVLVTGRLQNNNYENRDGEKVYATNLIVEDVEFAESKKASGRDDDYEKERDGGRVKGSRRASNYENSDDSRNGTGRGELRRGERSHKDSDRDEFDDERDDERRSSSRRRESKPAARRRRDVDDEFMDMDGVDGEDMFD